MLLISACVQSDDPAEITGYPLSPRPSRAASGHAVLEVTTCPRAAGNQAPVANKTPDSETFGSF